MAVRIGLVFLMDGSAAGDLEPGSAARPRTMVGGVARTGNAVVAKPNLVRGDQNPATESPRADLNRREQMRKAGMGHDSDSLSPAGNVRATLALVLRISTYP